MTGFKSPGQAFDTRSFKRHLENFALPATARAQVWTRLEDYRVNLLNRLGQLKDTFPAKIVKGLAFSPLTDIRSFVHTYLLDENLVDVKTLQAQLETLRHFESLAANVRERIERLNAIDELDKERAANRRRRITNTYVAHRAQADIFLKELADRRLELDSVKLTLSRAERERDDLTRSLVFAQSALTDAEVALRTDQTAVREKELREKIAVLTHELTSLRQRKAEIDHALACELADAKKLRGYLLADKFEIPAALETFLSEHPITEQATRNTQEALTALAQLYARDETLLAEKVAALRAEAATLESDIRKLRTGDREASVEAEAPNSAKLRRLFRAELGLKCQRSRLSVQRTENPG